MHPLGIETLSAFGLPPADLIRMAADLGCQHVTLNLRPASNRLAPYPPLSLRDDPALRRATRDAARDTGVRIGMVEGFALTRDGDVADLAGDLDHAAELGASAICSVSLDKDIARTHDQFARLAAMAAERGLTTTTEVGAGVLRDLPSALRAVAAVAHPAFGLLIDTMHFFRSGSTVADLAMVPAGALAHVQLCDVPMPATIASYMEEALFERRCPGDGDLPLADFIAHLPAGVPIGLEIPIRSEAEAGISAHDRLARCIQATRRLLGEG